MGQCFSSLPAHGDTPERFKAGRAAWLLLSSSGPWPACPVSWRACRPAPPLHCAALQGRWQQGGLGDGLAAYDGAQRYGGLGEASKPAYTTTVSVCVCVGWDYMGGCGGWVQGHPVQRASSGGKAVRAQPPLPPTAPNLLLLPLLLPQADVGLKARGEDGKPFGFMHDKAPAPLQLERIEEDATLQGGWVHRPGRPAGRSRTGHRCWHPLLDSARLACSGGPPKPAPAGTAPHAMPAPLLPSHPAAAAAAGCPEGSPMKQQPLATPGGEGGHQMMMHHQQQHHQQQQQQGQHVQRKPLNWTRGELVGQGAFGTVFVAMDNDTGELIAVKQVGAALCCWPCGRPAGWVLWWSVGAAPCCAVGAALGMPGGLAAGCGGTSCGVL